MADNHAADMLKDLLFPSAKERDERFFYYLGRNDLRGVQLFFGDIQDELRLSKYAAGMSVPIFMWIQDQGRDWNLLDAAVAADRLDLLEPDYQLKRWLDDQLIGTAVYHKAFACLEFLIENAHDAKWTQQDVINYAMHQAEESWTFPSLQFLIQNYDPKIRRNLFFRACHSRATVEDLRWILTNSGNYSQKALDEGLAIAVRDARYDIAFVLLDAGADEETLSADDRERLANLLVKPGR